MKSATILSVIMTSVTFILVTAVPAPAPAGRHKRKFSLAAALTSEEDGFFQVITDANGTQTVEFTPIAEIGSTINKPRSAAPAPAPVREPSASPLQKRTSACSFSVYLDRPDIDTANAALLDAYCPNGNDAHVNNGDWGWVCLSSFVGSTLKYSD